MSSGLIDTDVDVRIGPQRVADVQALRAREQVRASLFGGGQIPVRIGRFVLIDEIGSGGMGAVFSAYDPELDRKVAVKVIIDPSPTAQQRARLIREAQAMARLAHPNVVSVFEAGTHRDQVFIAMEYVDGWTLTGWLERERKRVEGRSNRSSQTRRSTSTTPASRRLTPAIVDVFIHAARGLAAAHAAGLVHRDFKPQNVLVDRSGRVRVLDFGLARGVGELDITTSNAVRDPSPAPLLSTPVTRTGALVGTPAYMAPEQHEGKVDPRSDQFAFCVALYEALYGERPFPGDTVHSVVASILDGRIRAARPDAAVPRALRAIVLRGLSIDPTDRYRDMGALLRELERFRQRRQTWWSRSVAAFAVAATVGGVGLWQRSGPHCEGARQRAEEIWNEQRRTNLATAFEVVRAPWRDDALVTVTRSVDAWVDAWVAAHTDACTATHVLGEQSLVALDLRMLCLAGRLQTLDAMMVLIEESDPAILSRAPTMVSDLPGLSACADLEILRAEVPPPDDLGTRERVEELRGELAQANALHAAARHEQARDALEPLLLSAQDVGYEPLQLEIQYVLADVRMKTGERRRAQEELLETYWSARRIRHDRLAARIAIRLAFVVGVVDLDEAAGLQWARHAEVELDRLGGDLELQAQLANVRGGIHMKNEAFAEARAGFERGLELREQFAGADDHSLATGLSNLASVAAIEGDSVRAEEYFLRALQLREAALGNTHPTTASLRRAYAHLLERAGRFREAEVAYDETLAALRENFEGDHPLIAVTLAGVGGVLRKRGAYDRALPILVEALEITQRLHGPESVEVAATLISLAHVHHGLGELEQAQSLHERALHIMRDRHDGAHDDVAVALNNLANVVFARGRAEEAEPYFREALAIRTGVFGDDHPSIASSLEGLAQVALSRGRVDEAIEHARRAVALWERKDDESPGLVVALTILGRAELAAARPSAAVAALERALQIHDLRGGEPDALAAARFAAAQALVADGQDRRRARTLAEQAREWYADHGPAFADRVRDVDTWLASR
jgi:eukaryotic-like serine/threonine-protein kinase